MPLLFWQHLAAGLSWSQAFIIPILFGNVSSLVEVTTSLAANNHGYGAFADGELGMNLIGLDEIDLPRADEHVARLANFGVIALRTIVQSVITDYLLMTVEHAVKRVNMGVVVDAGALALACIAFGQSVDGEAVIWILVKKQILGPSLGWHAIWPLLRCGDHFGIGEKLGEYRSQGVPSLVEVRFLSEESAGFAYEALQTIFTSRLRLSGRLGRNFHFASLLLDRLIILLRWLVSRRMRSRVEARAVVPENFTLVVIRQLELEKAFNGMGILRIAVGIVGGKDELVAADLFDRITR